jgi:hypothetical protein
MRRGGMRKSFLTTFLTLLWLATVVLPGSSSASPLIRYPQAESGTDTRSDYPRKLLQLALDKSGGNYQLVASELKMPQGRALLQLAQGQDIEVAWSMTSRERERDLLPIRIPIDRGLLGWRIFLIRQADLARFAAINTLAQLQILKAGQGHDWPDTLILRANQLPTIGEAKYEALFTMLQGRLIDYFPRSINEIDEELRLHPAGNLAVEPHIALHYPAAMYYFVNKNNPALAKAIEQGLQRAMADGSFEQLFQTYHAALIRQANLPGRTVFHLNNPLLPLETPLQQKQWWYAPKTAATGPGH